MQRSLVGSEMCIRDSSTILVELLAINKPLHIRFGFFKVFLAAFFLKSPNVFEDVALAESFKSFLAEHCSDGIYAFDAIVCFVVIGVSWCGHSAHDMLISLPSEAHSTPQVCSRTCPVYQRWSQIRQCLRRMMSNFPLRASLVRTTRFRRRPHSGHCGMLLTRLAIT